MTKTVSEKEGGGGEGRRRGGGGKREGGRVEGSKLNLKPQAPIN